MTRKAIVVTPCYKKPKGILAFGWNYYRLKFEILKGFIFKAKFKGMKMGYNKENLYQILLKQLLGISKHLALPSSSYKIYHFMESGFLLSINTLKIISVF
ncbi:hypothetical protein [Helicobacter pylori]|uniref:hypothetical protein n=1 Tax=Helicobacter pylori TaxID=210 RepID=UPI001EE90251|nr:hypothetical protein [Helicobacter pylori]